MEPEDEQGKEKILQEELSLLPISSPPETPFQPSPDHPSPFTTKKKSRKELKPTKHHTTELSAQGCPLSFVTVYNDRAELVREVMVDLSQGTTDITVYGISEKTDMNSIRVQGGKGSATILEVSTNVTYTKESQSSSPAVKAQEIKLVVEKLEKEIGKLKKELNRIIKEEEWLEGWARNLVKPVVQKNNKGESVADVFSEEAISKTEAFLDFYQKRLKDIDQRREEITEKLDILNKDCTTHKNELLQLPTNASGTPRHEVIITVHCKLPTSLELQLAYVVFGASWSASYDSRVTGTSAKIEIYYYGHITNDTREDWNNTLLALSTAKPSVAGKPPDLFTKFVYCKLSHPHYGGFARDSKSLSFLNRSPMEAAAPMISPQGAYLDDMSMAEVLETKATQGAISSTFNILRKAIIQADNKPHKVMVKTIKFPTEFSYTILPKLSPHVYLKANIKNTSKDYPLMPGPMNVFMDNNFVAKSEIPLISPNESLGIYLGVDQGVKFEYQPLKQLKETQGLITITNVLNIKFQTIITNNKSKEVKVNLFDNLPKSNDSQIKVRLMDPQIEEGNENVTVSPANNIQWKMVIPPGEKRNVSFMYSVEYPSGSEITNAF